MTHSTAYKYANIVGASMWALILGFQLFYSGVHWKLPVWFPGILAIWPLASLVLHAIMAGKVPQWDGQITPSTMGTLPSDIPTVPVATVSVTPVAASTTASAVTVPVA